MSNYNIVYYSFICSCISLFLSIFLLGELDEFIIIANIFLAFFAFIAYKGLQVLKYTTSRLKCSETTEFILKIIFSILFYIPIFLLGFNEISFSVFVIFSFISTISIITYSYKHLFSNKISFNKIRSIMETESFNIQHPEEPQQDKSSQYITKGVILLVMGAILLVSTFFIKNIIHERESTKELSQDFFEQSWGTKQVVAGPYLCIPYKDSKDNIYYAYLMPKDLNIDNNIQTEKRKKGIFENIVYKNKIKSYGYFDTDDIYNLNTGRRLLLDEAMICYGIEQIAGLEGVQKFSLNGINIETKSGLPSEWIAPEGLSAQYPIALSQKINFEIEISLKGTEGINFLPLGKNTLSTIKSNWDSPSFQGKYIPNEKPNISKDGFNAKWNIQHFNKTFPQFWLDEKYNPKIDAFGVDLKIPVNNYVKAERTIKYAALVIGLIFLIFFIIEINNRKNIHPIQYLLVGFSLCLFYGLLISFSELMDFNLSYLIASVMTILLISIYIYSVLKQMKFAFVIGLSLTTIYTYLYILLQQENYALLIGNLGLFIILAVIMYFTRKMNNDTPALSN